MTYCELLVIVILQYIRKGVSFWFDCGTGTVIFFSVNIEQDYYFDTNSFDNRQHQPEQSLNMAGYYQALN